MYHHLFGRAQNLLRTWFLMAIAWQHSTSLRMSTPSASWRISMICWVLQIEVTFNIDDKDIPNGDEKGDDEKGRTLQVEVDSMWQEAKQFKGEDENNKIEVMKNLKNYYLIPDHALNEPLRPTTTKTTRKRPCRELCRDEPA
ncbi:unnamed protein product [Polarella glacialis]|uniref:Uncharacterized protein n=1 Tax=Polarella glacialis TaxID=89957 RepID=A0A813D445_POLGL|nr:unnamed protein product [Polarella glacialis]